MKEYLRLTTIVLIFLGVGYFTYRSFLTPSNDHVHYHAGFKVYIDGSLQNYTEYKYMNFVPCSEHDEKKSKQEEQIEKAHLHDGVGDVVHVHRHGALWGDLFKNIKVELDKGVVGYIDGVEVDDILNKPIGSYTTAIFVVGESAEDHTSEVIPLEYIKQVETKSELCGGDN